MSPRRGHGNLEMYHQFEIENHRVKYVTLVRVGYTV